MAGKGADLLIRIVADAKDATKGFDDADKAASKWSSGLNKASVAAGAGLVALGAVALSGAKAAAEDEKAQVLLATAMRNNAGATTKAVAATEDWVAKTSLATGVADDQLRPALATLVRATGDVAKSQEAMSLALDISAATGKDLSTVSDALAKGYAGNTAALSRLVPGLDKGVLATKDMTAITGELATMTGGAASEAAGTAAGQYARMQVAIDETKESIGAALLPALTAVLKPLGEFAQWAAKNSEVVLILGGVLAGLAATVITVNAVTKVFAATQAIVRAATIAWTAVQWLLNAALTANPIGIVVVAIAALVAGIILAYKNCETFRNICNTVFHAVQGYVNLVVAAIGKVIDAIQTAIKWIGNLLDKAKSIGGGVLDAINPFSVAPTAAAPAVNMRTATARTAAGSGPVTINVTTTGLGASAPQIQDAVVESLRRWSGRNGALVDSRGAVGRYA